MYVKVSETYDLSTKPEKMGLLGIHTPDGKLVYSMWSGFFQNYRKMRFASCDVAMACASMLPADPLQIGVEAGDIAPQDMFNPILYKACSNDSMSNLLNKIYAAGGALDSSSWLNKNSVSAENGPTFTYSPTQDVDQFAMYYGLLSDTSGWKKAMPQAGLAMRGLVPITWSLLATQGQPNVSGSLGGSSLYYPGDGDNTNDTLIKSRSELMGRYMRGSSRSMPAVDTMVMTYEGSINNDAASVAYPANNSGSGPQVGDLVSYLPYPPGQPANTLIVPNLDLPNCFVAAVVLPPAKLNRLYYRLKVTWTIEFSGPRPLTDLTNWFGLANYGVMSYGSDYLTQSALITKGEGKGQQAMVDAGDMEITKVMEGSK
ncbi:MAG: hypothetical protein QXT77_10170 [Candidatus Methanomethylicaceae archaeon]